MSDFDNGLPSAPAEPGASSAVSSSSGGSSNGLTTALSALNAAASSAEHTDASAASGAQGTQTGTEQADPSAATTAQQANPATAEAQSARGPVPFERHEAAIANARTKALEPWKWAETTSPEEVKSNHDLVQRMDRDPLQFAHALIGELKRAGRWKDVDGPQGSNTPTAASTALPQPDFETQDGKGQFFSAATMQKYVQAVVDQMESKLLGQVQPLLSEREQQQARQEAQSRAEAAAEEGRAVIRDTLTTLRQNPTFSQNEAAISKEMEKIPAETVSKMGHVAAIHMAFSSFLSNQSSSVQRQTSQQVHEDLRRKANAATGQVTPNGQNPGQTPKPMRNVRDLAARMEQMEAQG